MSEWRQIMSKFLFILHEDSPKYKQIYEHLKRLIENNTIVENESLPSIRTLATNIGVSRNTTLIAYEQLIAEGYIRSEERRGYFTNAIEPIFMQQLVPHTPAAIPDEQFTIDFRTGAVDQANFPLQKWRQCANKVLLNDTSYTYGDKQGDVALREQLTAYLFQSRGISTSPNAIIIGSSTQQLLLFISLLLQKKYREIMLENPGYDGAKQVFQMQDFQIDPIQVDEKGHHLEDLLKSTAKIIYVTPSHHFPTGKTMPIQKRYELLQWAEDHHGYIIEDDYDSEYRYEQHPIPALASLAQERVIYIGTFSKAFLPAIRLSYMILPPDLLKQYHEKLLHFEQNASSLHQKTMALFMKEGHWYSHIRKMRTVYKKKMTFLVKQFENQFGEAISIIGQSSGLYVLIQVKTTQTENELIEKARQSRVKVYPTSPYYIKNYPKYPVLQIGFSNCSFEMIEEGVTLLKNAWGI